MRKQTRGMQAQLKYLQFMKEMYNQTTFNRKQIESDYKISTSICTVLSKRGFITTDSQGYHKWIGKEPSMELVVSVLSDIRSVNRTYVKQARIKPQQLTIKSIKRVERTQPVPVKEEPIYDTSNSKMLIILAVGTMIGFLVATLIWK
jgi:hypothetical protein